MDDNSIPIVISIMLFLFLGVGTYFDLRFKRIPWSIFGVGTVFAIVASIIQRKGIILNLFPEILPGVALLLIAWATKENIGYGDGISVILLGVMAGFKNCILVLCLSLLLLSIFGIILMILKRAGRKTKLPYLPFMFIAESILVACKII